MIKMDGLHSIFYSEIEKNIADEAVARQNYYDFLAKFENLLTPEEIYDFKEIIAEELKHSVLLSQMIERRNGIRPEV